MNFKEVYIKGAVEQTGKKLDHLAEEAENADTKKERGQIVDKIETVQIKRQEAIIDARKNRNNFKAHWKIINE